MNLMRMNFELESIRAVIFDLDGVIIDSEPIHAAAERDTVSEFGLKLRKTDWQLFRGSSAQEVFTRIVKSAKSDIDPAILVEYKTNRYLELARNRLELKMGVNTLLEAIRRSELKTALTTTSFSKLQQMAFRRFNLTRQFDVVITGDDVNKCKPDPEPYVVTVAKLGLKPSECLVIEDSSSGILSAKAAGCMAALVKGAEQNSALNKHGADYTVKNLSELHRVLVKSGRL